ncbi:MAG: hypothetical protein ACREIB_04280, partial [Pseudomonadota bacterium]
MPWNEAFFRRSRMRLHTHLSSFRWLLLVGICLNLSAWLARPAREVRASNAAAPLALVNAASYADTVAPGSIAALFSSNLTSQASQAATTIPLPTTLAGLTVKVNGLTAPLFFASASQINLQAPGGLAPGSATVEVFSDGSTTPVASGSVKVADAAPGIFTIDQSGRNQAIALNSDLSRNADFDRLPGSRPEAGGSVVVIYATGAGATNPLVADGQAAPGSPLARATGATTVTIGGIAADVQFSGLAPGFVGLWQINAVIPASLPTNINTPLLVSLKGNPSLQTTLAVANKNEFGAVTGSVFNAATGAGLAGAGITLQPTGAGKTRTATTNARGQYGLYV